MTQKEICGVINLTIDGLRELFLTSIVQVRIYANVNNICLVVLKD